MSLSILILTESGTGIGFGHRVRMEALQDYMTLQGEQVNMVVYEAPDESTNWMSLPEKFASPAEYDAILIDSYLCSGDCYQSLFQANPCLFVMDDFNRCHYAARGVINANLYFEDIDYSNQTAPVFGGLNYTLLRPPFWKRDQTSARVPGKVLVTLGGSDYRDLLPSIAEMAKSFPGMVLVVPEPKKRDKVEKSAPGVKTLGRLSAEEMYLELASADVVVSACGQTLNECLALGKKTIGICIDHDQEKNRDYFVRNGFLLSCHQWDRPDLTKVLADDLAHALGLSEVEFADGMRGHFPMINPVRSLENYRRLFLSCQ
ncbi:MAG: hypothetical protein CMN76_11660 [Spirochaetaceae bacterium]|nr:hypothetical protein [Spirochaetaceae bacterium]|tara:strand:+ start:44145 stop:45095 length:951 start_codon:yes stop_codon:yes gene_type:complete